MAPRAFITGLEGLTVSAAERDFLRASDPWGLILFKRNVETPAQATDLVTEFRAILGRKDAPVLIDQEGGRVQRLQPPHWPAYPPGAAFGGLYQRHSGDGIAAARLGSRLIAADLAALGITVDCLPLADVPVPGSHDVIGDRAYGITADQVAVLARSVSDGLMDGGVLPVLKHIPGHGRAGSDSHKALPVVHTDQATLEATDFAAFRPLADLPLAMTAHVVFTAYDPALPATTSRIMIDRVIRGFIGFSGALMSDDVSMEALSGSIGERTAAALAAGCDLALHCNGKLNEMKEVAANSPMLSGAALRRAEAALAARKAPKPLDVAAARGEFARMMGAQGAVA